MPNRKKQQQAEWMHSLLERKDLLTIVISSLSETVSRYTGAGANSGMPFVRDSSKDSSTMALAGMVCIESKELSLVLSLGFNKDLFLSLYKNMFPGGADDVSSENADLAGEILNIAFGAMDPKLRDLKLQFKSSLPKTYYGESLPKMRAKIKAKALVIPFEIMDQKFYVEIYPRDAIDTEWHFDASAA